MSEYNSAEERAKAKFSLQGSTPRSRQLSAELLVTLARRQGHEPEQWVLDVAEGRLPA
ncbi:hypothetical protein [Tsukamurella spumae]|uniref:Uncharacterized protein n=1 Tax=Tsukamurella spumae TaxID=44753 RepID=A0A846X549_9ACTN|nr:hypothetical protein [Tsukamurella spumae]NKY20243.1 hypothetical protein [Tsukamurella spumae]